MEANSYWQLISPFSMLPIIEANLYYFLIEIFYEDTWINKAQSLDKKKYKF